MHRPEPHSTSRLHRTLAGLLLLALACIQIPAWAWGGEGHRMVGYVADQELSPKARMAVRQILQADSLADGATWMDDVRSSSEGHHMAHWHFVNLDLCQRAGRTPCPNGNCAPARIQWAEGVLGDRSASLGERQTALKVLIHLVGDLHQPLHAADNHDHGGNELMISNRRCGRSKGCNLHSYWDSTLVKEQLRGHREQQAAQDWLRAAGNLHAGEAGDPWAWADESHGMARTVAYRFEGFGCHQARGSVALTPEYDQQAQALVRARLVLAGQRLAQVLNRILG